MKRARLISFLFAVLFPCTVDVQSPGILAIIGVTLIDGTMRPPVPGATVVIDGARIVQAGPAAAVAVPLGATIVDATGKFVIPGLIDMHNHLQSGSMRRQQNLQLSLRRMLAVGITTVFDPSSSLTDFAALKAASVDDSAAFARFFGTGPIVTVKGDVLGELVGSPTPENAAQARTAVHDLKAAGVDAIKVQYDDVSWSIKARVPMVKQDVLRTIVAEAHAQGLKVFVHAPRLRAAKEALGAGVDGLMHGIIDESVDREFLDLLKKNGASYVSTMGLYEDVGDIAAWARRQAPNWDAAGLQPPRLYEFFTTPAGVSQFQSIFNNAAFAKAHLPVQRANLKTVFDAGVPVVLGTDSGFYGMFLGVSTQIELELLVEAGLTPQEALRTAGLNAARMIGRDRDIGTLEPGKFADFVILNADPLADIRNVAKISHTFKGGVSYEPVDPAVPSP